MELYCGIDLHSNNLMAAIMDGTGKRILKKRLINDPQIVLAMLEPYRTEIVGMVVESTYNWYWLVDALKSRKPLVQ